MTLPDNSGQLSDNPRSLKRGDVVRGTIIGEKHGGTLFDIGGGNTAKLPWGNNVPPYLKVGDTILLSVVEPTSATGDAIVSIKGMSREEQEIRSHPQRYKLQEAADLLDVSKKTLDNWIQRHGWREQVDSQVYEFDQRAHYLTETQVVQLAKDHQRQMKLPELKEPAREYDPIESVVNLSLYGEKDPTIQQLKRQIGWLERQVSLLVALLGEQVPPERLRAVILGERDKELSTFDKEQVDKLIELAKRNRENIISGPETPPE